MTILTAPARPQPATCAPSQTGPCSRWLVDCANGPPPPRRREMGVGWQSDPRKRIGASEPREVMGGANCAWPWDSS